jgi:exosortase A-associated hydrolase 2
MSATVAPFFLADETGGQRLCLLHSPATQVVRGAIVFVHPFAEEMNKSRRMAALQARAFASAGYAVLQCDLLGCGDSSGDFGDATWDAWLGDVARAAAWLRSRHAAPLTLWGLRAGCLAASEAARRHFLEVDFLFWQPMTTGKAMLQQHLRLHAAREMLDGQAVGATQPLRDRLAAGETIEIAGYALNPALAAGLERATLQPPHNGRTTWLEVSTRDDGGLLPASGAVLQRWREAGHDAAAHVVKGPPFWAATEIEEVPELVAATIAAMRAAPVAECAA